MKKLLLTSILGLWFFVAAHAQKGFAIVIDNKSYKEATAEVDKYAKAIREILHLKTYLVIDRWGVPDSIRQELYRLYTLPKHPIEGAVFVGDIPIPMLRDAQHMTSAFGMDQRRYPRKESSVPSDRFYDDFDLKFDYLGNDTDAPYFYYSLTAESTQQLHSDIYSGRIRPTDTVESTRYEKLRAYLQKVVEEKYAHNPIDQIVYFSGHGYISESMLARIDEKQGLYEHFPWLKTQQNGIGYIDHSQDRNVKFRLMNELMRPELDLAILHHHGNWDTQYMNNIARPDNADEAKQYIQNYCRSQLRRAKERGKNVDSIQHKLMTRFDIPASWISDTFTPESILKDSLSYDKLDLHISDFDQYNYCPNARLVVLDACFCGSFHLDDCIANRYIFSSGKTIACVANSVNALQDKWADRFAGLLGLGMNVGNLSRFSDYLESHTIGDPTFRFSPSDRNVDVQLLLGADRSSDWKNILSTPSHPDLQCLAIRQLTHSGKLSSADLLNLFRTSASPMVRLEALLQLYAQRDDNFIAAIDLACNDSYEFIQRLGVKFIGLTGDERLIPSIIRLAITNNTSERTNFNLKRALESFPKEKLIAEFNRQFYQDDVKYIHKEEVGKQIKHSIEVNATRWLDEVDVVIDPETTDKRRTTYISYMRSNCPHYKIPVLLDFLNTTTHEEHQIRLLEALAWRSHSCMRQLIIDQAERMTHQADLPQSVRHAAAKTAARLK